MLYAMLGIISVAGIQALPLPVWPQWLLYLLVLAMLVFVVQRHAYLTLQNSIVSLTYQPHLSQGQQWAVKTKAGQTHTVQLVLQHCFVTPYLTVLNVQVIKEQHWVYQLFAKETILILPDRVAKADYRRLRMLLNWGEHQE